MCVCVYCNGDQVTPLAQPACAVRIFSYITARCPRSSSSKETHIGPLKHSSQTTSNNV